MKLKCSFNPFFQGQKVFAADLHIAFIVPDKQEHAFWQLVVDVLRKAWPWTQN